MPVEQLPKNNLWWRAAIIQAIRAFFIEREFLEVETPVRLPCLAPETHIEPIRSADWFLQTSPELCMKRLLAAGHPKVFQICKCFRAQERGKRHLSEFTMLEWYHVDSSYLQLMEDCEQLFRFLMKRLALQFASGGLSTLGAPWERVTVADAFSQYAAISSDAALAENIFDKILVEDVEPHLGKNVPTFLCDYPADLGSLARLKKNDPLIAERFELYVDGIELANGFSELTDPIEQRLRFEKEQESCREHGRIPGPMPEKFLEELNSLSSAAGIALGVDRLVMLLCGAEKIDDVVSFTPEAL
jgi:elongation factor P--(R)-beta-lysine ligase